MLDRLLDWIDPRSEPETDGADEADEAAMEASTTGPDDEGENSGFVPSRLDASVLRAHGMGGGGAEREIANVEEKARVLEEQGHHEQDDPRFD